MGAEDTGYGWPGTSYRARRVSGPMSMDGRLDEDVWRRVARTDRFVDIGTGGPAPFETRAAVLRDDDAMYVDFEAQDPHVTAMNTERDALLFFENDLEIFVDGGDYYYELEFDALATLYEVFYVWRDAWVAGGRWDRPEFDVHSPRTHSFAGDRDRTATSFWVGDQPQGTRWAFLDYDLPGLEGAVHVDGRLNDHTHVDVGWTAEVRLPWSGSADLANRRSLPPRDGDTWAMFFGRFHQMTTREPGVTVPLGCAASAHGVNDTHVPQSWTRVTFGT